MAHSFIGSYQNNMDAKGRVILPIVFREEIGRKFALTRGIDNNLDLFPLDVWEKNVEKLNALKNSNPNARKLKRRILGNANIIEIDNQDRITIPQNLREACGLVKEIIFVGDGDRIEVWSKQIYLADDEDNDYSVIAEDVDY